MIYQTGDIVLIKRLNQAQGELGWVPDMLEWCGKEMTVNRVCENGHYYKMVEDTACWN
jgi:hypothetical protein